MADIVLSMDGLLLNWLKQVGDTVKKGDIIAEFEADKATVEVEAPADGTISALNGEIGEEMKEGAVIGQIGAGNGAPASAAPAAASAAPANGQQAASSSSTAKPPNNEKAAANSEEKFPEEQAEASDAQHGSSYGTDDSAASNGSSNGASLTEDGRVKASPLARNIAKEKGIDLSQVSGTGPNGRIVKSDVENFTPSSKPAAKPAASAPAAASGTDASATGGQFEAGQIPLIRLRPVPQASADVELIDVSRMRKAITAGTVESNQQIPTFFVTTEMDLDPLLTLRAQLNASIGEKGVKISVNDMIVKAAALALREFPNLNSHYYGDKIARYKNINIGIAVAPDNVGGVIYVVAKDADKVSLSTLASTNKEMIARARELKLKPDDTKGATFSTSNLGPYEVDQFTAVINPPEAGVIAIGSGRKVPVIKADGTVGVGTRIKITLSVDHRVSDGAEGGQFMFALKALIENPMRLLL
jgi:pyruvate dehydrogenase E2 component (dihydrolipoamide acetyltransferase)